MNGVGILKIVLIDSLCLFFGLAAITGISSHSIGFGLRLNFPTWLVVFSCSVEAFMFSLFCSVCILSLVTGFCFLLFSVFPACVFSFASFKRDRGILYFESFGKGNSFVEGDTNPLEESSHSFNKFILSFQFNFFVSNYLKSVLFIYFLFYFNVTT
jgi:hypothetical protein